MTKSDNNSPEKVLSVSDRGDNTQLRYRYQAGYAALLSLGLLDSPSEFDEIFCEHHEDTLVKLDGDKFAGIQVKTKEAGKDPFKSDDEKIIKTIKRFIEHYVNFPGYFLRFVIATNHGFWDAEKKNTKNLHYMLDLVKEYKNNLTKRKHRGLTRYIRLLVDRVNSASQVNTLVTEGQVLDVLCLIELQEDLPKFEDLELRVVYSIQQHYDTGDAGYDDLLRAAKALIQKIFESSSLEHLTAKQAYFALCENPTQQQVDAIIDGKRITRRIVDSILSTNLSPRVLLRTTNSISISDLPSGMGRLELKLATGKISVENITLAKDQKYSAEYLFAQWFSKYGSEKADKHYNHVSSIVRNECAEAYDSTYKSNYPFGTAMLIETRKRLRARFNNDPAHFLGCQYEPLLGTAGILTETCDVW
jgi:hypothetical protein